MPCLRCFLLYYVLSWIVLGGDLPDVFPRFKDNREPDNVGIPFPPAEQLPELNGSAFPPYHTVFTRGECVGKDAGSRINTNKTCFQCFRIPTIIKTHAPGAGTILAFAEARRGGGVMFKCPDIPDTHLVYKRSIDGGKSFGPLSLLLQFPGRVENGPCQIQAAPVVDPVTNTIFVGFNQNGCRAGGVSSIINSTNDGISWSAPAPLHVNGASVLAGQGPIMGPTKGLAVTGPGGHVRLMLPGEGSSYTYKGASIYSDDHGATWNSNGTDATGEMDWTVCSPGACGGWKYAMLSRWKSHMISFSNDTVNWTRVRPISADSRLSARHAKSGMVSVPGGLVMSGALLQCPGGIHVCERKPSDVIDVGMALWISKDGITWKLLKRIWPSGAMYSTMIPLTVDKDGAALTYAVIYSRGSVERAAPDGINFQNFTFSPSDFDILSESTYPFVMI